MPLANEGEQLFLDVMSGDEIKPPVYYLRLFNDTPVEDDSLSDLVGEASGSGYAPILLNNDSSDFPVRGLDSGDYQITSKQVTFTATGGSIGPVTYVVLATSSDNSGKLVAYVALSQSRLLADNETLKITFTIKLQ